MTKMTRLGEVIFSVGIYSLNFLLYYNLEYEALFWDLTVANDPQVLRPAESYAPQMDEGWILVNILFFVLVEFCPLISNHVIYI